MKQSNQYFHTLVYVFSFLLLINTINAQSKRPATIGDVAPGFSLVDFEGKKFTYGDKKDDQVRVFWFTNLCSGCQSVILEMEKLKKMYESKNVEIVAVSQLGEERRPVEKIIKEKNLSFRFLYDPKGEATSLYSGKYTPGTCPLKSLYIVKPNGVIQFASHFPGVYPSELKNQIDNALKKE